MVFLKHAARNINRMYYMYINFAAACSRILQSVLRISISLSTYSALGILLLLLAGGLF